MSNRSENLQSEVFFAPFFEEAPAMMARLTTDGRFERVNRAWKRILGLEESFLEGKNFYDFVHRDDHSMVAESLRSSSSGDTIYRQCRFQLPDGSYRLIAAILRGSGPYIYWMGRDVTDDAHQIRLAERERIFSVFMGAPSPISIYSGKNHVIQFVNELYLKVVGVQRVVLGKPLLEAIPEVEPAIVALLDEVYRTGKRFVGNEFPINLDWEGLGQIYVRHFNFVIEPVLDPTGKVEGIMSFSFDVSELVKAKKALEESNLRLEEKVQDRTVALTTAVKELEAFSYSVSHDLRSPLRGIAGFAQAIHEDYHGLLDDTGKRYLRFIEEGIGKMGQLIDDLLSLSRLSRSNIERQKVDLSAICEEVIAELRQIEPDRKVQIFVEPGVAANADPGLMRIVLYNLLANAWKFTSKVPRAEIRFGVRATESGNRYFVEDNGAGFDMAFSNKLFGAFQRLHSPDEGYAGTGIGLATVRRIVHRHGGTVYAEGTVNKGATFYFTL